jgi:hypothetical protein
MALHSSRLFDPLRFVEPSPARPREALIAEIAYLRAQRRGFEPGHELEDWLAAEAEVDRRVSRSGALRSVWRKPP